MGLSWMHRTTMAKAFLASAAMAGLIGAADVPGNEQWTGVVKPGSGWLRRQGLAESFSIQFTLDASGRAKGSMIFNGNTYPAMAGKVALKGERDPDGSAFYLFATIEGHHGAPAQAEVKVTLTGFDEEDGSLRGVGVIDMADLACVTDAERSKKPCARRMVPVKWTAKK